MTWPALIALALGAVAAAMICASQNGIGTTAADPQTLARDDIDTETPKEHPQP
ncbi:hypothetical protein ACFU98_29820 [Streptomyces sp. NPDC057575]|uniref:hypothetical protein n=1 Tax=unclassified Streptomyces TaxID=2593676 RepID=UPI0036C66053